MPNNPNAVKNLKPCKPGETHNPNGKKKGTLNYKTRLKQLLSLMSSDKTWTSPLAAEKIRIAFGKYETDTDEHKKGEYIYPIHERQKALDSIIDRLDGAMTEDKPAINLNLNTNLSYSEAMEIYKQAISGSK